MLKVVQVISLINCHEFESKTKAIHAGHYKWAKLDEYGRQNSKGNKGNIGIG